MRVLFYWLGNRDSNPNRQSQSLLCYRYTIPQWICYLDYYTHFIRYVNNKYFNFCRFLF